jgi:hypothetical protein
MNNSTEPTQGDKNAIHGYAEVINLRGGKALPNEEFASRAMRNLASDSVRSLFSVVSTPAVLDFARPLLTLCAIETLSTTTP